MIKIAVPSRGEMVDQHFGHCESFAIFTVGDDETVQDVMRLSPPSACGCKSDLVPTLVTMGVSILIAGGMGQGAADYLNRSGIKVFRGAQGSIHDAVHTWLDGRLRDSGDVCHAHGGCEHS